MYKASVVLSVHLLGLTVLFRREEFQSPLEQGSGLCLLPSLHQEGPVLRPHPLHAPKLLAHGLVDTGGQLVLLAPHVDPRQPTIHLQGLVLLQGTVHHLQEGLLSAVQVLQVQPRHPHIQLLLLLSGGREGGREGGGR